MDVDLWVRIGFLQSLKLLWGCISEIITKKNFFLKFDGLLQTCQLIRCSELIDQLDLSLIFVKKNLRGPDIAYFLIDTVKVSGAVNNLVNQVNKFLSGEVHLFVSASLDFTLERVRKEGESALDSVKGTLKFRDFPQPHRIELSIVKLLLRRRCLLENPSVTLNRPMNFLPSSSSTTGNDTV